MIVAASVTAFKSIIMQFTAVPGAELEMWRGTNET